MTSSSCRVLQMWSGKVANLQAVTTVTLKMPVSDLRTNAGMEDVLTMSWHWGVPPGNNEVWHTQPVADPRLDLLSPPAPRNLLITSWTLIISSSGAIYIQRIKSNFMWQTIFHCDTSVYYSAPLRPANTSHKQYHMDKIWKHNYPGHVAKTWLFSIDTFYLFD